METINKLHSNTLLPHNTEDECRNILFETPTISLNTAQINTLHFDYPIVSQRVRLAKRLTDNAIYEDYNHLVSNLESSEIGNRATYQLKKLKQKILPVITELQQTIEENDYSLDSLSSKNANYKTNLKYYENTYIYYYLQQMLIWYILEFQAHFNSNIPEDKNVSLEEIYVQHLKIAVPDTIHISTTPYLPKKKTAAPEIDLYSDVELMPTTAQIFLEEVKKYSFFNLDKIATLNDNQKKLLITKMTARKIPYVVAMLDFLRYPKYLKDNFSLNKTQIYRHISKALNNVAERQIKGNFLVLEESSEEDKGKYTSHQYTEEVKTDYQKIASITN